MTQPLLAQDRAFWSGVEELVPTDLGSVGFSGVPSTGNKVVVDSMYTLAIDVGYVGLAYDLDGPADDSAPPFKLGMKKGDKVQLRGPMGTEPNHGRILTFTDPSSWTVLEPLSTPDATLYEFTLYRRGL